MNTHPSRRLNRRNFLKMSGMVAAGGVLAACTAPAAPTTSDAGTGESAPGGEEVTVVVWYQDWDGANRIMDWAAPEFTEQYPNATLDLQPIGYDDLLAKLLPSIASGTEGDVLNMYTDWVVATDVSQVFLDITDAAGGFAALEEEMYPAAFGALDAPEGKVYYLPWLAGLRGATTTVNQDHLAEAGIDYLNFGSYEEMIEAGVTLTQKNADGKITRSGYSPRSSQYQQLWSMIWQLGGDFFDRETGTWSHSTPEGEEAAQIIYNIYHNAETCDFELFTTEFEAVSQQLVSIWGDGAWTAGVQTDVAEIPADNIVTPMLEGRVEDVIYPQHIAGFGLSRRLAERPDVLDPALAFAQMLVSTDALIQTFDFYSGVCMTKGVYEDPRIEDVKYGPMSKRVAQGVWPIARFPGDHVAQQGPASTELDRAMRGEITITEALANMDAYLQEQENQARERIGL